MDRYKSLELQIQELEKLLVQSEQKADILTNLLREATMEFHQALEKISTSEANFRAIIENAPEAIYIFDVETHSILDCNPYTVEWLGYDRAELLNMKVEDLLEPKTRGIDQNVQQAVEHGSVKVQERQFVKKDGTRVVAEVTGTTIQYRERRCFVAFVRDITERKKLEELSRYKELFDNVIDPVIISHVEGKILEVNDVACERLLYPRQLLLQLSFHDLVNPRHLHLLEQMRERLRCGGSVHFELDVKTCDGALIPFEFHSRMIEYLSRPAILSVGRDLSSRKKMEQTLVRQERLSAVGELAAGVAHNFNNLLQIIMSGAEAVSKKLSLGEIGRSREAIQNILEACNHGVDIVNRIKKFTTVESDEQDYKPFDLGQLVSDAIELTRPLWSKPSKPSMYRLTYVQPSSRCLVKGNPSEIYEVLVNLIKNALEAMPAGGKLTITSEVEDDWVTVYFSDTGHGIAKENLEKIFEPFFTTKGSKSSGLGLSSSYGIIKKHQGEMKVKSYPGQGAVFSIRLPRARLEAPGTGEFITETAAGRDDLPAPIHGLLVDDEVHILRLMEMWFEDTEVEFHTVDSAPKALEAAATSHYDVIVCDFGMDDMNGLQLCNKLKDHFQHAGRDTPPMVLCTGLQSEFNTAELAAAGIERVVKKPISASELLSTIRDVVTHRRVSADPSRVSARNQ